ncbi:PTS glucitol/sorbitol transporter subunit IIA [Listeria seeligeri]|uniref:PTS glucitol/sorbitol transporter subunit IIA n=1 Tax=Listeria seeligeri TaxID=1640 RepID=UPI0010E0BCF9|nr:PTS glucitol/sorbitol transporter subunit IIA [Listeria seeligeri]MBC1421520.1 PTS glucitol/sorbitol transporter subunit IIA [Listeria seeligeri]MBC1430507.1 PTS glucitol/sorbitol transporter subunit IIA [Listeria seeligeri]MBC1442944.1 PTS glucitol/sorbitol transporter subunit IIA [Listeria seeligeri]MBC1471705.1 PTS glucitol/sorbitol transporter subunit IIA [Listeria seeligeri]MBC1479882.1 PTS glucitol/sorbitol transporter subunit IIA [Listeria seeligeri]
MTKSKIIEIGPLVPAFEEEKIVILFGPSATNELREISVIHELEELPNNAIQKGNKLTIGQQEYIIEEVGTEANKNLEELGHISIYFRSGENEVLPGAIVVSPEIFPTLTVGDTVHF